MINNVLYIVVPCFNEQEVLPSTNKRLLELLAELVNVEAISPDSRVLYVDDGSDDDTWNIISRMCSESPRVTGLKLAGNVGHQNALLAGLEAATTRSHIMVTIDADLQDDCTVIKQMLEQYEAGCDVVYGVRSNRKSDSWFKRTSAQTFYKLMRGLGVNTVYNHADFRLMSQRAVKHLLSFRERNLFLRGIVPLVGYRSAKVYYERTVRTAGESKYPLGKMISFAVDGITSFSIKPVRMVFNLGVIFLFIALCMFVYTLIAYFTHRAVSGWASLILSLWFIGGCVLLGLGIVGEYIGKIYIEVKDRPRYNVETKVNLEDDENQ